MGALRMARDQCFLPRRQVGVELAQRLRRLVLDARNLVGDVAAGSRQRAQFIDLGFELGDGLFEIEIRAHVIRHQINIRRNALSSEADSDSREKSPLFQLFSPHSSVDADCSPPESRAGRGSFSAEAAAVTDEPAGATITDLTARRCRWRT